MTIRKSADVTDADVLAAVADPGMISMTYIVASRLRLPTAVTRRRLLRLEREGRVERAPTFYLVQICWKVTGK